MGAVEDLARGRRWLLLISGVSFAAWHLGEMQAVRAASGDASMIAVPVAILAWLASMIGLFLWARRARRKAALEDELTQHNRRVAFANGFWAMLIVAAAGLALASHRLVEAPDLARLVLVAGVSAPLVSFFFLELPVASGE